MTNLTVVTPGGVERPDLVIKKDLDDYIQAVANVQEDVDLALETLQVRVPTGRTINSRTLTQDIVLDSDDIGTYDKDTIDRKLEGISSGGYIPVRVNGHLLDQDIFLTAADIQTFTAVQIDSKLSLKVDNTRTINGKPLSSNIVLTSADVGSYTTTQIDTKLTSLVPTSRTINDLPLTSNITITASSINTYNKTEIDGKVAALVPRTFTVNGRPLTGNITLTAADVGAFTQAETVPRTFTVNGRVMSGLGININSTDVGTYPRDQIDTKLLTKIDIANEYGLGIPIEYLDNSDIDLITKGSGFFGYMEGLEDRPSDFGQMILLNTLENNSGLAFPGDRKGLLYRRIDQSTGKTTPWIDIYSTENPPDSYTRTEVNTKFSNACTLGAVGSYALCVYSGATLTPGSTVAGSLLKYSDSDGGSVATPILAGSWRLMGNHTANKGSLYVRVS